MFSSRNLILSSLTATIMLISCNPSPTETGQEGNDPESCLPDFYINSIEFTGDSTLDDSGEPESRSGSLRSAADGDPYCQVTITWETLADDSVAAYELLRSSEPCIRSDPASSVVIGSVTDSLFVDNQGLEWEETYYYAVTGIKEDSTIHWSDEVSITMPDLHPSPSVLSARDRPIGRCLLEWTECTDPGFESYTLMRYNYGSGYGDTVLAVFTDPGSTSFFDSIPPPSLSWYYLITTTNTMGLTSESNILHYRPGYGTPWLVSYNMNSWEWTMGEMAASDDEKYVYYVTELVPQEYYMVYRVSTVNWDLEQHLIGADYAPCIDYDPISDQVVVTYSSDYITSIMLCDGETLDTVAEVELGDTYHPEGLIVLPDEGKAIVSYSGSISELIDLSTLESEGFVPWGFTIRQYIQDYGIYIYGEGPLQRVDPATLEVSAISSIVPSGDIHSPMMVSSSGELCLATGSTFYRLNPYSLSILETAQLPSLGSYSVVLPLEVADTVYAYVRNAQGITDSTYVYNMESLEYVGDVIKTTETYIHLFSDMLYLEDRNEIWASNSEGGGVFRIRE